MYNLPKDYHNSLKQQLATCSTLHSDTLQMVLDNARAAQSYWVAVLRYTNDFMTPFWLALNSFLTVEKEMLSGKMSWQDLQCLAELLGFNLQLGAAGIAGSLEAVQDYHLPRLREILSAWRNTVLRLEGEDFAQYLAKQVETMDLVATAYPEAIKEIESEYGFHFDDGGYVKAAETERFVMYQVLPRDPSVRVRENGKPILIIPPYVLGHNILAFLPGENRSYVHCYANQGIPTYVRVLKEIDETPAVQVMTAEDDTLDTRDLCKVLQDKYGKPVTLNGFCQGGLVGVIAILSGELDGLVDAFITCAAPMDGTRSKSLVGYLNQLPDCYRDLGYALTELPNGNEVVDGKIMSWVYKIKSIDKEAPLLVFYRDLKMLGANAGRGTKISKTAAAINYWLIHDQRNLPRSITQLSYDSYTIPVTKDGTLPVRVFGRELNFKRIQEKGIKWLICYAAQDELVEKEAALAPLDYIDAEVTAFPKGHASIATSWSIPTSECALHTCFPTKDSTCGEFRGPVRYQLDLEQELERASAQSGGGDADASQQGQAGEE